MIQDLLCNAQIGQSAANACAHEAITKEGIYRSLKPNHGRVLQISQPQTFESRDLVACEPARAARISLCCATRRWAISDGGEVRLKINAASSLPFESLRSDDVTPWDVTPAPRLGWPRQTGRSPGPGTHDGEARPCQDGRSDGQPCGLHVSSKGKSQAHRRGCHLRTRQTVANA